MGLALGIVLLVAGVFLITGVGGWSTPFIPEVTLGWLLLICGGLAVVAALFVSERQPPSPAQRRHDEH